MHEVALNKKMKKNFSPTEIWTTKFPEKPGICIHGKRPCIIIQCFGDTVTVIPLTRHENNKGHPYDLLINRNTTNNLTKDSIAKLTQIQSLDKIVFIKKIGIIDKESFRTITEIVHKILED